MLCYDNGRRHYSRQFVVFARNREDGGVWRFGLAVTKKTGCAVIRNRVKRVVREFFRCNQSLLCDGFDLVIVPKRTLQPRELTYAIAERELLPLLDAITSPCVRK
ncbi:MAG: Ribonuclease P protein component [Desulfovibrio sp.]